jgi:hypothetical protein
LFFSHYFALLFITIPREITYPMKLRFLAGIVCLFVTVLTVTSCEKDKAVLASGSCSFTFDSTAYSANSSYAYVVDTNVIGKKALILEGVTASLNSHIAITVFFPDTLIAGEFTEAQGASILFSKTLGQEASFQSTTTTIKITSINSKYAEGTFIGSLNNGTDEKPLTDGKFKVNISNEN